MPDPQFLSTRSLPRLLLGVRDGVAVEAADGCKHIARVQSALPVPAPPLEERGVSLTATVLYRDAVAHALVPKART